MNYAKLAANLISDPELFWSDMTAMLRDIRDGKLVVVPAEPTADMLLAGRPCMQEFGLLYAEATYHAMLAASQEKP